MPDAEHHVIYKAIADFSGLARSARAARAELKALKDDQISGNKELLDNERRVASEREQLDRKQKDARKALSAAEANAYRDRIQRERIAQREINSAETDAYRTREARARAESARAIQANRAKIAAETSAYREQDRLERERNSRELNSIREVNAAHADAHRQREAMIREEIKHYAEAARIQRILESNKDHKGRSTIGSDVRQAIIDGERFSRASTNSTSKAKVGWAELGRSISATSANMRRAWHDTSEGTSVFTRLRNAMRSLNDESGRGGFANNLQNITGVLGRMGSSIGRFVSHLRLTTIGVAALITALGPLISVLGALGGAAIGVASSLGSLAGAVGALPGLFLAAASGVGALAVALPGVMSAFKAFFNVQKQAGIATGDTGNQQRTAARQIRDATRQIADAEYSLAKAHERVEQAQKDLNRARQDALKDLKDLREEVERGSLNEEGATLALARAQDNYRKALADPTASLLDRQQALLDVKNAEWDLHDVQQTNIENAQKLAEEEKKGVEGSDKVVAAKQAVEDANHGVIQAEQGLQQAIESLADAQTQAAAPASALAKANDALEEALSKLSPSARAFVEGLFSMSDAFKEIRGNVQEALFGPLVGELDNIKSLLPTVNTLLEDAAGAIGRVAARGIEMLSSGPWKADFATLSKSNVVILENFGDALLTILDAFRNIAVAAIPFTNWISKAIKGLAEDFRDWAKAGRESGSLTKFFDDLRVRMQLVGSIIGNLLHTFLNFGKAALPFGDDLLKSFEKITQGWEDFSAKQTESGSKFKKWLESVKPLLHEVALLVKSFADGLVKVAIDPENIKEASNILHDLATKTIPQLFDTIDRIGKTGAFRSLLEAINSALKALSDFIESGGGGGIVAFFTVIGKTLKFLVDSGLAKVFGVVAVGLGALAAVAVVGKFTGLFKLFEGFAWLLKNRNGIAGALSSLLSGGGLTGAKTAFGTTAQTAAGKANFNPQITQTNLKLDEILLAIRAGGLKGGTTAAGKVGTASGTAVATGTTAAAAGAAGKTGFLSKLSGKGFLGAILGSLLLDPALDFAFGNPEEGTKAAANKSGAGAIGQGALLGSIGGPVGAVAGAVGGEVFSLATDKNAREQQQKDIGGDIADTAIWATKAINSVKGFFKDISKPFNDPATQASIGTFIKDNIFTPISDFFSWIGKPFNDPETQANIGNFIYDSVLTPIGHFFSFIGENIVNGAAGLGNLIYDYVLTPIGHFFVFIGEKIGEGAAGLGNLIYDYVLTPIGHFFSFIGESIANGASNLGNLVYDYVLTPIGHFFLNIGKQIASAPTALGDIVYKYILTPIGHFFQSIGGAIRNAAFYVISQLPGGSAIVSGLKAMGYAKGGRVRDGVSVVGEYSPEFMVKHGSQVDIIPMSQATFGSLDVSDAPGFNFGSDYGRSALDEIRGTANIPAFAHASSTAVNNDNGINIEKLEINNPIPEKSGDSLFRGLQKARYLTGQGGKP